MAEQKKRSAQLREEISERQLELDALVESNRHARQERAKNQLTVGTLVKKLDELPAKQRELPVVWGDDKKPVTEIFVARFRALALGVGGEDVREWQPQLTAVQLLDKLCDLVNAGVELEDVKGNSLRPTMETTIFLDNDPYAYSGLNALVNVQAFAEHVVLVADDLEQDSK